MTTSAASSSAADLSQEPAEKDAKSPFDMQLDNDDDEVDISFSNLEAQSGLVGTNQLIADAMIESEKKTYMQLAATNFKSKPLETWKEWCTGMPLLGEVARKWLAVPASSASSERVFSSAGLTISKKRTKLGAERAATLVFLKTAWPTLQKFGVLYDGSGPSPRLTGVLNQSDSDSDNDEDTNS